jgi:ATP-dependent Zn protease
VRGRFKNPIPFGSRAIERFKLTLPFAPSEGWVTSLVAKGVEVRGSEERQSFGVWLFSFLPYALIFGLLVFMLRRQRKA